MVLENAGRRFVKGGQHKGSAWHRSGALESSNADTRNAGHLAMNTAFLKLSQQFIHDDFFYFSLNIGHELTYNGRERASMFLDQVIQVGDFNGNHIGFSQPSVRDDSDWLQGCIDEVFRVLIITTALLSALLSSLMTLGVGSYLYVRHVRPRWERRLQDLHQEIGRLVETRVRKAMAEALSDTSAADVLRDRTWQVARSGADMVNDGLNVLLGRRKRD